MFDPNITLERLNDMCANNMPGFLGIEFTEIGDNYLCAKMPVDHRTTQPLNMLHGGASVVLAETLGSIAANICVDGESQYCVGLEINANHIKKATIGETVFGRVEPFHVGKNTQVWQIKITNEANKLVCVSRITMAVMNKNQE